MTPEKRDIQIILNKLGDEYSELFQKVNRLDLFISQNIHLCADGQERIYLRSEKTNMSAYHTDLLKKQWKVMNKYLNILKERIDDLSKQFKECK